MAIISLNELKDLCDRNPGRLMGMDVGSKTVGLALSDMGRVIASPFKTLDRKGWKQDLPYLAKLIKEQSVIACVIGLPINMDGSEGERCAYVRDFGDKLQEVLETHILYWDERLSTVAVERMLLEADLSRKRRGEVVDKLAASYILQGVLDRLSNMR
jgi:putative holliday junction resolvase